MSGSRSMDPTVHVYKTSGPMGHSHKSAPKSDGMISMPVELWDVQRGHLLDHFWLEAYQDETLQELSLQVLQDLRADNVVVDRILFHEGRVYVSGVHGRK